MFQALVIVACVMTVVIAIGGQLGELRNRVEALARLCHVASDRMARGVVTNDELTPPRVAP